MSPGEFDARFTGLSSQECFRLELLDCYDNDSPVTRARVQRFLVGEADDPCYREAWDALLEDARAVGKAMSRVHVVTEPLSDYAKTV